MHRRSIHTLIAVGLLAALLLPGLAVPPRAQAATFTVTNTNNAGAGSRYA